VIAHIVLFRPRPDLSPEDARTLSDTMALAMQRIPSVRRARIGTRVTHGRPYEQLMNVDYSHAAVLEFDDLDGLKAYLQHPEHQALASRFFAAVEEALMYDFRME
jgi:hypothetical protein